uniref:Uncharacterized protein n=1 Tax=Rhizophora mucronata TaxID=61149 RepID=A0A2P2JVM0_RHIMU
MPAGISGYAAEEGSQFRGLRLQQRRIRES